MLMALNVACVDHGKVTTGICGIYIYGICTMVTLSSPESISQTYFPKLMTTYHG